VSATCDPLGSCFSSVSELENILLINPPIALGGKKITPSSPFALLRNSVQNCAEPFYNFSWIWMGHKMQQSRCRSVHRKLFDMSSNTGKLFCVHVDSSSRTLPKSKYYCNSSGKSKVFDTSKCNSDGQLEIAIWPPNLKCIISRSMTHSIEIPKANLGLSTTMNSTNLKTVSADDCDNDRQPEWQYGRQKKQKKVYHSMEYDR